jgi:acyl-CoA synthetase (NDP forming)
MRPNLVPFSNPTSVAVVGASRDATKMGGASIRNLRHYGFAGTVYAIDGRGAAPENGEYATLRDCPTVPDVVVMCLPSAAAMQPIRDAFDLRVPAMILVSSGFAEATAGSEGAERQAELQELIRKGPTRVMGPNTAGLADFAHSFVPRAVLNSPDDITPGPVGVITQSGAVSNILMNRLHSLGQGVGLCVGTGDEADVRCDDWLVHAAERPDIETVIWAVEGVRNGPGTLDALVRLRQAGKRVVVLHIGGSEAGQEVAATHTGALATPGASMKALCDVVGAVQATDIDDACRIAIVSTALATSPDRPLRVMTVCGSGGEAALLADKYYEAGVELPAPSPEFTAYVDAEFSFARAANPFDLTGEALSRPSLLTETLRMAQREDVDLVHLALPVFRDELGAKLYSGIAEVVSTPDSRLLTTMWVSPGLTDESWASWRASSATVLDGSTGVPSALGRLARAKGDADYAGAPAGSSDHDLLTAVERLEKVRTRDGIVSVADFAEVADALGLRTPQCVPADRPGKLSEQTTYYVKGYRAGVVHKRAAGLVVGPLTGVQRVTDTLETKHGEDGDTQWYAEAAAASDVDLFVAIKRDPLVGTAVLLSVGGGLADLFRDSVVTLLPGESADHAYVKVMNSPLGAHMLATAQDPDRLRSAITGWLPALLEAAQTLTERFDVVELNPVLISSTSGEVWAVDVVVELPEGPAHD